MSSQGSRKKEPVISDDGTWTIPSRPATPNPRTHSDMRAQNSAEGLEFRFGDYLKVNCEMMRNPLKRPCPPVPTFLATTRCLRTGRLGGGFFGASGLLLLRNFNYATMTLDTHPVGKPVGGLMKVRGDCMSRVMLMSLSAPEREAKGDLDLECCWAFRPHAHSEPLG